MSRQNKVNPGMYTQRGRLAQDDAAREIAKQRSVGSEHTWQPVQRDHKPRVTPESEGDEEDAGAAAPNEKADTAPARVAAKKPAPAKTTTPRKTTRASATSTARMKKPATPAMRGKARTGRTTKAKSARRKS